MSINSLNTEGKDPYLQYPTRALAYSNELGVTLQPLIGPGKALALWAPAMAYFGMDIHDKYKKGVNGEPNSVEKGVSTGIFHLGASILGPTAAIYYAQKGIMKIKIKGENIVKYLQSKITGGKMAEWFGDTTEMEKPKQLNGFLNAIHRIPLVGHMIVTDPVKQIDRLKDFGITNKGGKNLSVLLKIAVGALTLGIIAKPLDKLNEHFKKKVVEPALGIREQNFINVHDHQPIYQARKPLEVFATLKNRASA